MAKRQHAAESADVANAREIFDHAFNRVKELTDRPTKAPVKLFPRGIELISLKVGVDKFTIEFTIAGPDSRQEPGDDSAIRVESHS